MIIVKIRGNIGNQMFQYACARKIQEVTKQKICLNIYDIKKYRPDYNFKLDKFILNNDVIIEEKNIFPFYFNTRFLLLKIFRKLFPNFTFNILSKFGAFIWFGTEYKKINYNNKKFKNIYLDGYFQSTKYFEDIDDILKNEFTKKEEANNKNIINKLKTSNSVCLSIRRGDYINNIKNKKKFFYCDKDYFLNSIEIIKEKLDNPVFCICSDDIEWAKKNIQIKGFENIYESGKDDVDEKIMQMKSCNNFIISNSTFSWWTQHLSENNKKIVIAPSKWYKNKMTPIYEKNWITVDV